MAQWSLLLFGHYKPDPSGADIKRASPGDIIDINPISHSWGVKEKKGFLPCSMTLPDIPDELMKVERFKECEWDLDSYRFYNPSQTSQEARTLVETQLKVKHGIPAIDPLPPNFVSKLDSLDWDIMLGKQLDYAYRKSCLPETHWRKRRFNVPLSYLDSIGVDIDRMLDVEDEYTPEVSISFTEIYDKLLQRNFRISDGLNWIASRTLEEILEAQSEHITAESILNKIR